MAAPLATAAGGNAAALADAVVVLHFAYAAFVVGGFAAILLGRLLGWGWIRNLPFRIVHFAAMAFVGVEGVIGLVCPLTELEYRLRLAAGAGAEEGAFIARLAARLLYYDFPLWVFTAAYVALTLLAAWLLYAVPPRRRRRS
jgi:hypothetical protein